MVEEPLDEVRFQQALRESLVFFWFMFNIAGPVKRYGPVFLELRPTISGSLTGGKRRFCVGVGLWTHSRGVRVSERRGLTAHTCWLASSGSFQSALRV
jgi:hypothetical protein